MKTVKNLGKRLTLLSMDWTRPKDPPISLGQASILANLVDKKIPVIARSWSVNHSDFLPKQVVDAVMEIDDGKTDMALGAFVWNEKATKQVLSDLKKYGFKGRIILGGPQISYVKNGIEKYYPEVDIFVRGYAEEALAKFYLSEEERPKIKGIHYAGTKDDGLSAEADLEKLPSPFLTGIIKPQRFIRWETQRGCPFRCAFCQHRESDTTQIRRNFELPRVLSEADWICENKVIQDVAVLDPTFNSGSQYMVVMKRLIEGKFSGKLALQIRLEMITPEFLDLVEELNKTGRVVLECGIQTIHKAEQKLIDRPNNMKKVSEVLEECKKRGIETELSLIFGLPGQTFESFRESVEFCKKCGANKIYAFPLMLLRGTPLHSWKDVFKMVESDEINLEKINRVQTDIPHVVSSYSFSEEEWKKMADLAESLEDYNLKSESEKKPSSSLKSLSELTKPLSKDSEELLK